MPGENLVQTVVYTPCFVSDDAPVTYMFLF